ncbi:15965_t:CDS:2 [Rhizophagus irregularis]|nr:15965_t:CDS:2 [Rhizophagus irregularis]
MAIERELDKESHYTRINDFYGSNLSVGFSSTYNTIFKELDSVLQANLLPILLSIQRAQMNQSLLYQVNLVSINQIEDEESNDNNDLPTNSTGFITIINGEKNHTTIPLSYMNQLRTDNVYTMTIREKVNKKIQYGAAMSIAKTSIQIAVTEGITAELIGILTQFIMKYRRSTSLSIEKSTESLQDSQGLSIQDNFQPLSVLSDISNPEYHKPKG